MLPAAHRLRRSKDFAHAVRRGRRSSRGSVVVHLTNGGVSPGPAAAGASRRDATLAAQPADTGTEPAKAGFVVSKAVGGAVVRNKVKRRLRHLVAERIDKLPPGSVLVVRALPQAALTGYQMMALDLDKALEGALSSRRGANERRT
jgi:ribonuclease P protein component